MNEALRLLRRCLRPFGYDVRHKQAFNLLPLKGIEQAALKATGKALDQSPRTAPAGNLDRLVVILRSCLREERGLNRPTPVTGARLIDNSLRCLRSTLLSVNQAVHDGCGEIQVIILDDHSEPEYFQQLETLAALAECPVELRTTRERGQGASLLEQFEFARDEDALFYFCEDDYLHERSAISEMWAFYRLLHDANQTHLVLHPQEHENLYGNALYPSYLLTSERRHWRTTSHATHVLFTHGTVVRDYWSLFENTRHVGDRKNRRLGSERQTTNRLFETLPGFAPIPALAGHLQSAHCLPPFFDWQRLWEEAADGTE